MAQSVNEKIIQNPKFCELTTKRNRFSLTLLIVVLVVYFSFVFTAVLAPQVLSLPLSAGMTLTIGLPIGFGIMVFCFIMTGIYVRRANSEFDALTNRIVEEAHR